MGHGLRFSMMIVILSLPVISACKSFSGSEAKRVGYEDPKPTGSQKWTEARMISFNKWAADLLAANSDVDDFQKMADGYFAKLGVQDAEKLNAYNLSLRPGSECFREGSGGHDIWWDANRDQIKLQVESAAQFIFDFHKAMYGRASGPFAIREVEICPESVVGRPFFLLGQKLVIGVPSSLTGGYKPFSSDKIVQAWNEGEHLGKKEGIFTRLFTSSKLKSLWRLFNPIGPVRVGLRATLHDAGINLGRTLGYLMKNYGVSMNVNNDGRVSTQGQLAPNQQTGLRDALLQAVGGTLNAERLVFKPETVVGEFASQGRLDSFVKNWACAASSQRMADEMSHGILSVFDQSMRQETNEINVEIRAGLVAVGNYHRIGVNFAAAGGPFNNYIEKPNEAVRSTKVSAKVSAGLVSVFTIDDINVDAAVQIMTAMAAKSMETASFDTAARATRGEQSLCQQI